MPRAIKLMINKLSIFTCLDSSISIFEISALIFASVFSSDPINSFVLAVSFSGFTCESLCAICVLSTQVSVGSLSFVAFSFGIAASELSVTLEDEPLPALAWADALDPDRAEALEVELDVEEEAEAEAEAKAPLASRAKDAEKTSASVIISRALAIFFMTTTVALGVSLSRRYYQ